jgi:PPE-repeat protein
MQTALRSSLAMGIAGVGAGVIAMMPAAAPPGPLQARQPTSPEVSLGALADLLPPPSAGAETLLGVGNAIAGGANLAAAPAIAIRAVLPTAPLVPPNLELSLLTGPPNLGTANGGGVFNAGISNDGSFNTGSENDGNFNIGTNNRGSFNIGFGNVDALDNEAVANIGIGNNGDFNVGANNIGSRNFGTNNVGALNFGSGNLGAFNNGINNRGVGNAGIGNTGVANVGFFNQGSGNFGAFNSTNNNIGVANIGIPNPLGPAVASAVGGSSAPAEQTNASVATSTG